MKKWIILPALAAVITLGIGSTCIAADETDIISSMKSQNTLKYQDADGEVALYGGDIMLLAGKLAKIPNCPFAPDVYTDAHAGNAINIIDSPTTRQCPEYRAANDLESTNDETRDTLENVFVATYVSNYDGTHQVLSDTEIMTAAEPCTLEAEPDTYDTLTGKAVYSCKLCGYSTEDEYTPAEGDEDTEGDGDTEGEDDYISVEEEQESIE